MIPSDNPFLIQTQSATVVNQKSPTKWVFDVSENGYLQVDFLQMTSDLDVLVTLLGPGAKCQINCSYLCNKNNKLNINIKVLHKSKETQSIQRIRGLSAHLGSVSFNGTITIPHDSQKCDGYQNHRGIVLSDTAHISAVPQLEIWADDVKCAHGSAIGPLNQNQIFYLQTRGIPENEAKKLLLSSFFGDFIPPDFESMVQDWMNKNV